MLKIDLIDFGPGYPERATDIIVTGVVVSFSGVSYAQSLTDKTDVTRKIVQFDDSKTDQRLLDAISTELSLKNFPSFSTLCKAALH